MKYFIFEGVDGAGKTSVMKEVARLLIADGINVCLTKEPGGPEALGEWEDAPDLTPAIGDSTYRGMELRKICYDPDMNPVAVRGIHRCDSLLNWFQVVKPALESGKVILSDRGWPSDVAYGMVSAGLPFQDIYDFNEAISLDQLKSSCPIFFEVSRDVREQRLAANRSNFYDEAPIEFRDNIVASYNRLKEFLSHSDAPFIMVNADNNIADVTQECYTKILEMINE